jgi:lipopolysaccharide export LptBFGC system permease protein LptF
MFVATILPILLILPAAGVRPVNVVVPLVVLAYCHAVFVAVVDGFK